MRKIILATIIAITLTTPTSVSADNTKSCPQYERQLRKYGLPVKQFSYIMWRESRCNPKAVSPQNRNGSYDYGAVQVNSTWRTVTSQICKTKPNKTKQALLNLHCNLKVAKYLYDNGGLGHWKATSGNK